ncbi:MAG TPA: HWE histidine kinase domain-containing protein [Azospirillaceae bacterium]|nr:HWE histidine kinase domain-containing protein [Azospirillaceae bacterium]
MTVSPQVVIDLLPEPVLLLSREGVVLHANDAFERATGGRRPVVGHHLQDMVVTPADDVAAFLRRCAGSLQPVPGGLTFAVSGQPPVRMRCDGATVRRDDGGPGPIMLRCIAHRQAVSEFQILTEKVKQLSQEVLRRRQTEKMLRASEERLRLAVDAAEMGTWDFEVRSRKLEISPRLNEFLGLSADTEAGYEDILPAIHPEDRERVDRLIRSALASPGTGSYKFEFRTHGGMGGTERWLSAKGRTMFEGGRAIRFTGAVLDVTERRRSAEHQKLLINELNHRVKNTLATVHSIAAQTLRHSDSLDAFGRAFIDRVMALSQTHNLLTQAKWRGMELRKLLEAELRPYGNIDGHRLSLRGGPVHVGPKAAVALGLSIHELATNAAKYGALATADGRVEVDWRVEPGGPTGARLLLEWRERDGPPVAPPQRRGFGSRLIERGLAYELGGEVRLLFDPEGVRCLVSLSDWMLEQSGE